MCIIQVAGMQLQCYLKASVGLIPYDKLPCEIRYSQESRLLSQRGRAMFRVAEHLVKLLKVVQNYTVQYIYNFIRQMAAI